MEKKSEGHCLELENIWIRKLLHYKVICFCFKTSCGGNIILEMHDITMKEQNLEGVFHVSETLRVR